MFSFVCVCFHPKLRNASFHLLWRSLTVLSTGVCEREVIWRQTKEMKIVDNDHTLSKGIYVSGRNEHCSIKTNVSLAKIPLIWVTIGPWSTEAHATQWKKINCFNRISIHRSPMCREFSFYLFVDIIFELWVLIVRLAVAACACSRAQHQRALFVLVHFLAKILLIRGLLIVLRSACVCVRL